MYFHLWPPEAILRKLAILSLIFLAACSQLQKKAESSVNIGDQAVLTLLDPQDIFPPLQLVQVLTMEHQNKKNSAQMILTSKDQMLSIVALMPLGGELFRVEYSQGEIRSRSLPFVAKDFDLKFALADIILVYADLEILKKSVSKGVEISESPLERTILFQAKPLIRIQYSETDKFAAKVRYEHLVRDYKIQIQPISRSTP